MSGILPGPAVFNQWQGGDVVLERVNLAGALVALAMYALCIVVFVSRLAGRAQLGHAAGWLQFVLAVPLVVLLVLAPRLGRPWLYYLQVGLMLAFLAVEFVLDYALKVDFRGTRAAVIPYVMIFFAGTGGMLGVAALAGRGWTIGGGILFLAMAVLAFVQRGVTGM
jgi:hypothetical protein